MRYVKKFNESLDDSDSKLRELINNIQDVEIYLDDIFQELTDSEFVVNVVYNVTNFRISITKPKPGYSNQFSRHRRLKYKVSEVSEYILSAIDYMKSVGYPESHIICENGNLNIDREADRLIENMDIYFTKDEF